MAEDLATASSGIGSLADPVRRALYEYVVGRPYAVGREEAAQAVDVPLHTAKFHLDRLVEQRLLDVEFKRLTGRSGPGAGRPSKLYRRSSHEVAVSLPPRRYDIVGHILATAFEGAGPDADLDAALHDSAAREGLRLAEAAEPTTGDELARLAVVLAEQGYEPRVESQTLLLANCPFDALAREHTVLVCGVNQSFVQAVADGLGCSAVEACLEPEPGQCCVKGRLRSEG